MLSNADVAVVIPALNESLRIREVVEDALAYCPNVIVVDDGSDDDTSGCIEDLPITLLRHSTRMGKGASLRDGFAEADRQGIQGVVTMDGDGQHSGADIPRLIAAANRHPGNIIIGARLKKRSSQPWYRRIGNDFGDWGIAFGCGYRLVDSQSGQRFYPRSVFTLDNIQAEGFVFEAQILISAARRAHAGVVAVPIETRYAQIDSPQQFRKSHFRLFRDLWLITSHVVKQVLAYGNVFHEYRVTRSHPVVIDSNDTSSEPTPRNSPLEKA